MAEHTKSYDIFNFLAKSNSQRGVAMAVEAFERFKLPFDAVSLTILSSYYTDANNNRGTLSFDYH